MIDIEGLYINIARSLKRGATVRVNHDACPAGRDTKRRLYLTCPEASPNVVLGYCHNCAGSGIYRRDSGTYRNDFASPEVPVKDITGQFEIPTGMTDSVDWPTLATNWRIAKGLSMEDCGRVGIKHDPTTNRVYIPSWETCDPEGSDNKKLLGFQLRKIDNNSRGPKYYTSTVDNSVTTSTSLPNFMGKTNTFDIAVIVEDLASGIHIQNAATAIWPDVTVNVIVNYGTKVAVDVLNKYSNFKRGLVWLDNDGIHIKKQAEDIARVWRMLSGSPVDVELLLSDPKHYGKEQIINILQRGGTYG